ncbi:MAG: class II fructose-bisphosphate aldolase [Patescibacteria group bacterium]
MLTHIKSVIRQVKKNSAVGAFNTFNLETTLAIARAVKKSRRPVIIQVSEKTIKYAGLKNIIAIVKSVAESETGQIPVALHLDHGRSFDIIVQCVKAGFSSVHFDGSELPLAKNIALTKKAALYGHRFGVWAQGELGALAGQEGMEKGLKKSGERLTDPKQVKEFVRQTGVDALAISLGTKHGRFVGRENIDFKRLKEIRKETNIPLVLHGASGVKSEDLKRAVKAGINIVNLDTDLRLAFVSSLRQGLKEQKLEIDPREIMNGAIKEVERAVFQKINLIS